MAVLLNVIASASTKVVKVCKMHKNMGQKLIISSNLGFVPNILSLKAITCADKRSGGSKISSQYFIKMLSILRYLALTDPSLVITILFKGFTVYNYKFKQKKKTHHDTIDPIFFFPRRYFTTMIIGYNKKI